MADSKNLTCIEVTVILHKNTPASVDLQQKLIIAVIKGVTLRFGDFERFSVIILSSLIAIRASILHYNTSFFFAVFLFSQLLFLGVLGQKTLTELL